MTIQHTEAYRKAFGEYLRKGTLIRLYMKQAGNTDQYVWRTQRDERVRRSHLANEGHVFSCVEAPATGHPGEDYNCRCEAIPYTPAKSSSDFMNSSRALRQAMVAGVTVISFVTTTMAAVARRPFWR